jgi:sensor histidine kinase YesM
MNRFILKIRFRKFVESCLKVFFWAASYFILLNIFAGAESWQAIDHIYTFIFLSTLLFTVTLNFRLLVPYFLNRKKYLLFLTLSMVNIFVGALLNQILFDKLIDYILPGYYFISYYSYADLLKFFFVFVVLTALMHLSWEWFQLQENRHRMVTLEKGKLDAELKALMNQVNPHFLFNSLTVLYSLALKNASETPGAIIKLSDILRYVIYESAGGQVPLISEVNLIQNYIDLQQYRIDQNTRVTFRKEIYDETVFIAPMLLLPLLENSFKHGAKGDIYNTFIDIVLQSDTGQIIFLITNNKTEKRPAEEQPSGIGLKNIADRLKLIYPDRHTFLIKETDTTFSATLKINIGR